MSTRRHLPCYSLPLRSRGDRAAASHGRSLCAALTILQQKQNDHGGDNGDNEADSSVAIACTRIGSSCVCVGSDSASTAAKRPESDLGTQIMGRPPPLTPAERKKRFFARKSAEEMAAWRAREAAARRLSRQAMKRVGCSKDSAEEIVAGGAAFASSSSEEGQTITTTADAPQLRKTLRERMRCPTVRAATNAAPSPHLFPAVNAPVGGMGLALRI